MSFFLFLLVVVSLSCGSATAYADPSWRSLVASVGLVAGWCLLCHVAARSMAKQVLRESMAWGQANRWLQIQLDILRWLGLPVALLCLAGFGLAPYLIELPVIEQSLVLQSIGLLLPGITILMATWSAEHQFGAMVGLTDPGVRHWAGSMLRAFRSGPAWLLGPTLLFMGAGDVLSFATQWGWLELPTLQSWGIRTEVLWVVGVLTGLGMLSSLPWLITRVIHTEPMDAAAAAMVRRWLNQCGISTRRFWGTEPIRWNTGHRTLNALVAGFVPWGRKLLLSDRVMDELPRHQLMMVVMHEVAHAKRFHVPIRMIAIAPAWFVSAGLGEWLLAATSLPGSWGPVFGGVIGLATTIVSLGAIAYVTEIDADRTACRLALRAMSEDEKAAIGGDVDGPPRDEVLRQFAAQAMGDALIRVTAGHPASRRASWLHPSLAMRLRWLQTKPAESSTTVAWASS